MIHIANNFLSVTDFGKKKKLSRQRIHILIKQNRIQPEPIKIGKYNYISKFAKIIKL